VEGDACLYATLMGVAAASGDLQLAFSIQEDMIMDGLRPCMVCTSSALNASYFLDPGAGSGRVFSAACAGSARAPSSMAF
jgi:hypothetical protein